MALFEEQRVDAREIAAPAGGDWTSRHSHSRLAALYEVGRKVLSASTLDDLNDLALGLVFDCVNAERGALLLRSGGREDFVPRLLRHRDGRALGADELQVPTSIVREVVSGHVGILTSDALLDPRFAARASVQRSQIRSALCVPLWDEGEIHGVVYLDSRMQSYAFTVDDLELLTAIGNLIAIRMKQDELHGTLTEERVFRANLERFHSPAVVDELLSRTKQGGTADFGLEEREVSILFADLKDFTPLAETLELIDVAAFLNDYYARATKVVFEHGGTVNEFIGDSVMAIFGAPVSYPDHAERAVRAALDLLRVAGELERAGSRAQVRVAINSGRVVAGSIGPPSRLKYAVVGDAVNVAARLEGIGQPGEVTLGEETFRRLKDVPCEDLGPVKLKGREREIRVYRIVPERVGA